jgi:hypothetical protein
MPKTIITDPKYLSIFKKKQIRQQIPSLALLALSFLIGFIVPMFSFRYPAIILTLAAIVWFKYVETSYRFKQRIDVPDGDLLLSPITGRVRFLKSSSDISLIKIGKSVIDLIDIRSPHASCVWDADTLKVNYRGQNLIFRFDAEHLHRFEDASMDAGNTIGYIVGSAVCSISIPKPLQSGVKLKEICMAGLAPIVAD